jgi:hypothetical protein
MSRSTIRVAGLAAYSLTLSELVAQAFPNAEDRETFKRCMRTGEDLPSRLQPAALHLADSLRQGMIEADAPAVFKPGNTP